MSVPTLPKVGLSLVRPGYCNTDFSGSFSGKKTQHSRCLSGQYH
ncbi:hypothetical protein [Thiothrix litoralis]|nr:hypothetical protein [Thiothrix litoralis]